MDVRVILLLAAEAAAALVLLHVSGVLKTPRQVLVSALLTAAVFALRGALFSYETLDYLDFLSVWVEHFRANGGLAALGAPVGNYNVPYLFFLSLFSYSDLPPLFLIKLLSVCFDVILAWASMLLVGHFTRTVWRQLLCFFLVLFWPTVVLNGALWGQCDSIYTAFAVLSVWLVLTDRPWLGVAAIAASFAFKLQAVFVLPVFLLFWLSGRVKWYHFAAFPAMCVLLVLPAALAGRPLWDALTVALRQTGSIGSGLNYNSPSLFALLPNIQNTALASRLGILAAALVIALLALLVWPRGRAVSDRTLLLCAVTLSVAVPFFLPHMHDRYFFPADILTLTLVCTELWLSPLALLCEFASLLGYHAYLKMRYLLPMAYGAWALAAVLAALAALLLAELRRGRSVTKQTELGG